MKLIVIVLFVTASACFQIAVATICKPDSTFTMDCNTCICSDTGREYACTKKRCPPIEYKEKYLLGRNKAGYGILRPKSNIEPYVPNNDNEFGLVNRNTRKIPDQPVPAAYVKNDISSAEDAYKDNDNDYDFAKSDDNDDDSEYNSYEKNYFDTDSEEISQDDKKDSNSFNFWNKVIKK